MYVISATIGSSATAIIPKDPVVQRPACFQSIVIQAPAHDIYVGDSAVSSSNGVKIASGTSMSFTCPQGYTESLDGWYIAGTAADKVVVLVIP